MKESFFELSMILTGFDNLKPKLSETYFEKLMEVLGAQLTSLLNAYDSKVKNQSGDKEALVGSQIWSDPAMQTLCQVIISLWYTARLDTANLLATPVKWVGPQEAYFESLLWKAIDAHPPALSGGYHGYWRYAPEN